MPRPTWKGYLKLSLVSCPVALYPATSSRDRISFHIMNRKTGDRTRYLVVDSETQEPVEPEDRVRGFEIAKNNYVFVEDEELDAVKIESTHTIDIDRVDQRERHQQIRELTRGWGADLVTEFVGVPAAVEEGARLLRQGGRYLWIGNITPGLPSALDPGTVVLTAQTIRGVAVWEPWALPRALDFLRRRRHAYPFHKIVSDVFPFADIDGAFRRAETGSAIRVSLSMA